MGAAQGDRDVILGHAVKHDHDDADAAGARADLHGGDLRLHLERASGMHRAGEVEQALAMYLTARPALGDHPELENQIGICHLQCARFDEAMAAFHHALSLAPEHLAAAENLARAHLERREFAAARTRLEAVLARNPHRDDSHRLLGFAHLHLGDIDAAARSFLAPMRRRFAPGGPGGEGAADPQQATRTKLRSDVEQLTWLAGQGLLSGDAATLIALHEQALTALPAQTAQRFFFPRPGIAGFEQVYNRLHMDAPQPCVPGPAINPALDASAIEDAFFRRGWVCFDDFLTPAALAGVRRFVMEPTLWFEMKFRNEVGASLRNGLCCPLLLQIAEEIRDRFPALCGSNLFTGCFSYKYFVSEVGGNVHADRGAVSLNFWVTPDEACLDRERSGLLIWDERVPRRYFHASTEEIDAIHAQMVNRPGARPHVIPYRGNRAMLFRCDTLHATDRMSFREGYENRRVSLTFLYGKPGDF